MLNTVERRNVLRAAGAAGAAAVAGLAVNDSARADDGSSAVMGTWVITHQDNPPSQPPNSGRGVVTLGPAGILQNVEIAPPGGVGGGSWESLGGGVFEAVFLTGSPGGGGQPDAIVEVRPTGRVRGDRIWGTYTFSVSNASTGQVLFRGTGRFHGTRLEI